MQTDTHEQFLCFRVLHSNIFTRAGSFSYRRVITLWRPTEDRDSGVGVGGGGQGTEEPLRLNLHSHKLNSIRRKIYSMDSLRQEFGLDP